MKKSLLFACSLVIILGIVLSQGIKTEASAYRFNGWGWASNIGLISFNSDGVNTSGNDCQHYCVEADTAGNVTGYAWSDHIGWIKFGGLSGFPAGNSSGNAKFANVSGTWNLTGWARACSGTATGDCSSMSNAPFGWDGWIELTGANHSTTIDSTSGNFSGFLWGTDPIGFVDMSGVSCHNACGVSGVTTGLSGTCIITNPISQPVAPGTNVTFAVNDASGGTSPYTYSWNGGAFAPANTFQKIYNVTGDGPTAKIEDSAAAPPFGPMQCPSVNVTATPLKLNIDTPRNIGASTRTSLQVIQGNAFALKWTDVYAGTAGFTCTTSVTPLGSVAADSTWNSGWGTTASGNISFGTGRLILGPNNNSASFNFLIDCDKNNGDGTHTHYYGNGTNADGSGTAVPVTLTVKKSSVYER